MTEIIFQLLISMERLVVGHALGYALGLSIAVGAYWFISARNPVIFMVSLLAPIPLLAWMPFLISAFGIGEVAKIAFVVIPTTLFMFFFSLTGFMSVDKGYLEVSKLAGFRSRDVTLHVLMPHSAMLRGTGQRIAIFIGWFALAIAERALGNSYEGGIGYTILKAYDLNHDDVLWSACLVLAIAALLFDQLLHLKQVWLNHWAKD